MAINIFKKKQAENSNGLICKQKKHWEILSSKEKKEVFLCVE